MFFSVAWLNFNLQFYFSFSLPVPAAQAVVRTAFQDSPGEQEGPETIHSAGRDKEVDSDQYTSFEIG